MTIHKILTDLGVDKAVSFSIIGKAWGLISGPITIMLIVRHFLPVVQGYFYTFNSLLALQVFIELGLGYVITQFASHEWSKLQLDEAGYIVGDQVALSRLVSLGRFSMSWYGIASFVAALGLAIGGYVFFLHSTTGSVSWVMPWLFLCVCTGLKISTLPAWSILEGCGQVVRVYQFRFFESVSMALVAWASIMFGAELWTAGIATAASVVWAFVFIVWHHKNFFKSFLSNLGEHRIHFRKEVWPMQWRIAISWMSGYFTFSLFTPILFYYQGAVAAGQMGMTWSLVAALSAVSSSFILTRSPGFGAIIARGDMQVLDELIFVSTRSAVVTSVVGSIVIEGVLITINYLGLPFAARLLGPVPTAFFLMATIIMQISLSQATYLRAHKQEPFLRISILSGVLVGLLSWFLGKSFGAIGVASAYFGVSLVVTVPFGTRIWLRCREEWYGTSPETM